MGKFKFTKTVFFGIAILVILIVISAVQYYNRPAAVLSAKIESTEYSLPDSSLVVIGVDSKLEYNKTFKKDRTVKIKGNINLKISDLSSKMIILVDKLRIESNNSDIEITTSGKVIKVRVLQGNAEVNILSAVKILGITVDLIPNEKKELDEYQHFTYVMQ